MRKNSESQGRFSRSTIVEEMFKPFVRKVLKNMVVSENFPIFAPSEMTNPVFSAWG